MNVSLRTLRWKRTADRFGPKRLLSICLEPSGTDCAILSRKHNAIRWEDSVSLPAFDATTQNRALKEAIAGYRSQSDYIAMVSQLRGTLLRLISFPGRKAKEETLENQVRQTLGVDETHIVRNQQIADNEASEKPEFSVLACAMPVLSSKALGEIAEEAHLRPATLTIGGVAAANLVQTASKTIGEDTATAFLHLGHDVSHLLVFRGTVLTVIREFQLGTRTVINSLMDNMDLDEETTVKLFQSGSFDIGGELVPALGPWLHHIVISLDFCERRYGERTERLYVFGCGARSKALHSAIAEKIGRPVLEWDPLESLSHVALPRRAGFDTHEHLLAFSEGYRIMEAGLAT